MQSLYLATTLAAAVACLLTSLLIFACKKSEERSSAFQAIYRKNAVGIFHRLIFDEITARQYLLNK